MSSLSDEQRAKIEQNKLAALAKRNAKIIEKNRQAALARKNKHQETIQKSQNQNKTTTQSHIPSTSKTLNSSSRQNIQNGPVKFQNHVRDKAQTTSSKATSSRPVTPSKSLKSNSFYGRSKPSIV